MLVKKRSANRVDPAVSISWNIAYTPRRRVWLERRARVENKLKFLTHISVLLFDVQDRQCFRKVALINSVAALKAFFSFTWLMTSCEKNGRPTL